MGTALADDKPADDAAGADPTPAKGAVPCNGLDELSVSMKQFTESLHQKGSTVVSWITTAETMGTDRSQQLLTK